MYINVCDACICDIIDVILIDLCKTSISFYRMKKIYHIYHTVLHRMYMYLSCCHVYPLYTCMVTYWFILFFLKVYYWLKVNTIFHKSLINTPLYFEIKKNKINNACFIDLSINAQFILPPILQCMCLSIVNINAKALKKNNGEREITTFMNWGKAISIKYYTEEKLKRAICSA